MYKTLTIIKPLAIQKGYAGKILDMICQAGFKIIAMKLTLMSKEEAEALYKAHEGKKFYEPLIKYMSSEIVIIAILEKENAVEDFRKLIGDTDPEKAEPNTIRKLYGTSIKANAVHGSDSDENAESECELFFTQKEIFPIKF